MSGLKRHMTTTHTLKVKTAFRGEKGSIRMTMAHFPEMGTVERFTAIAGGGGLYKGR